MDSANIISLMLIHEKLDKQFTVLEELKREHGASVTRWIVGTINYRHSVDQNEGSDVINGTCHMHSIY